MKKTAFTLLEITIVVVILGVLSAVMIPRLQKARERTIAAEAVPILEVLLSAQVSHKYETGSYADDIKDLDVTFPLMENFFPPVVYDDTSSLAEITRKNGCWRLSIDRNATISCGTGAVCPIEQGCTAIGY